MINTWQLSLLQGDTPMSWLLVLLAIRGLALGMTVQTTFAIALATVPLPQLARGSSLINGSRFLVQPIGVAVLATVLVSTQSSEVRAAGQRAQEALPAASAPFGLCETPGVPAGQNLPPGFQEQTRTLPPPPRHRRAPPPWQEFSKPVQRTWRDSRRRTS